MQKPLLQSLEDRCLLSYQITDLGTLPGDNGAVAQAINDSGQVAGTSQFVDEYDNFASEEPFLWDATNGMQALPVGRFGDAYGINHNGQVVGDFANFSPYHAFLWDAVHGTQDLGTLLGDTVSQATGINNNGQVIGASFLPSVSARAFLWDATNGMQNLGTLPGDRDSIAYGINHSDQVVGYSFNGASGLSHAFLWDATNGMQDLGTLPGDRFSIAYGINDTGQVVGASGPHAFLWDATNGMQDLGTLPGDSSSVARSINDSGQVVGESCKDPGPGRPADCHAFLWQNGTLSDLNDLIPPGSRSPLGIATAINNAGQIVAIGGPDLYYSPRAILLTPDSSPLPAPAGRVHFTRSDVHAVLLADSTVTAADVGVHPCSLTLATLGDQTLTLTDTAEATRIGKGTVTGTSDAAAPAGRTLRNATDALFAGSHGAQTAIPSAAWEAEELELELGLAALQSP
jgi:probable HAF family extracellular repeat protein